MKYNEKVDALGAFNTIAFQIAKIAHHGQTDKSGDEYFQHPVRVADMALKEMPGNPYVYAVAILHDVLEDTEWTEFDIRAMFSGFPTEDVDFLIRCVKLLTRTRDNESTYYEDIKNEPVTKNVKKCDIRDNTDPTRLAKLEEATQIRLIKKYSKALEKLT